MPKKVEIILSGSCSARVKEFEFDLSGLTIGNRSVKGLTMMQYPVRQVKKL